MLSHRIMTLGHIVATTKIGFGRLFGLGQKDNFDGDKFLAKKGVEMLKEWQSNYQVDTGIGFAAPGNQIKMNFQAH